MTPNIKDSKDFIILNDKNDPIDCTLRFGKLPNRLVIICVGFGDHKDIPVYQQIAELTREAGFNVLSFNYSKDSNEVNIHGQVADTAKIVNEMSKDFNDISIIGGSLGAITALISAIDLGQVKLIATANGFFGGADIEKTFKRKYQLVKFLAYFHPKYNHIINLVKKATLGSNFTKPILLVHGEDDTVVNPLQSKQFFERAASKEKKLEFVKNADHGLSRKGNVEEVIKLITDCFLSF